MSNLRNVSHMSLRSVWFWHVTKARCRMSNLTNVRVALSLRLCRVSNIRNGGVAVSILGSRAMQVVVGGDCQYVQVGLAWLMFLGCPKLMGLVLETTC